MASLRTNSSILQFKKTCTSKVTTNKYEKSNPESQIWWTNKFKELEDESRIPLHNRLYELEEIFTKTDIHNFAEMGVDIKGEPKKYSRRKMSVVTDPPLSKLIPEQSISILKPPEKYQNPYLSFMNKPEVKAQIWRPHPKPTAEEVPLIEKAKIIETTIAREFYEWFSQVGSQTKSEIEEETILSIFELCMSFPVVEAIYRNIFEIGAVPEETARYVACPEKAASACVRRQIKMDIRAARLKPRYIAFNKILPVELRRKPFTEDLKAKWFEYQIRHQDLETMAAVWREITDLHTTQVFIKWLLRHPEISPPIYLKNEGLMSRKARFKTVGDLYDNMQFDWEISKYLENRNRSGKSLNLIQQEQDTETEDD